MDRLRQRMAAGVDRLVDFWDSYGIQRPTTWKSLLILVSALCAAKVLISPINHDVAWHLYAAGLLLEGKKLYVDILEYNPPLIYYLNIPPALISRWLGISAVGILNGAALGLVFTVLALCWKPLCRLGKGLSVTTPRILLLAAVYALVGYEHAARNFAQREHLMVILVLPYLIVSVGRLRSLRYSRLFLLLVGVTAGLGIALKPHFALLFVGIETYFLVGGAPKPWRKTETLTIGSLGILYLFSVAWIFPEYFRMLQMASATYSSFDSSIFRVLLWSVFPLIALWFYALTPIHPATSALARILGVATLCFLTIGILPLKGWPYHFLPATATGTLLATLVLASVSSPRLRPQHHFRSLGRMMAAVVFLCLAASGCFSSLRYALWMWEYSQTRLLANVIEQRSEEKRIVFIDTSILPAFPVVNYSDARWCSRFPFLWPLPAFYGDNLSTGEPVERRSTDDLSRLERFLFDTVIEDLRDNRPELVFVNTVRIIGFEETRFDFIDYFSRDARFSKLWQDYKMIGIEGTFRIYRLQDQ